MLTRQDAVLVRMLSSCAKHAPAKMRAEHMAERAEDLAKRIEAATVDILTMIDS